MKKYMLIYFLISVSSLYSQWEFVGLDSMVVRQIQVFGDTIWAGTAVHDVQSQISGLYRSTNKGKDWAQVDTALGKGGVGSLNFHQTNHNIIYLLKAVNSPYGGSGIPFKSTDGGKTWTDMGLSNYLIKWFNPSPFNKEKFYAVDAFSDGVYKSDDGGDNWKLIGEFPVSSHGSFVAFNFSRARDSLLFAYDDVQFYQAFYKSTDDGYSWQYIGQPPSGLEISTDNELECRVYMESYFITDNCGLNWKRVDSSATPASSYLSFYIDTVESKLYLMKTTGIYASDKQTITWQLLSGSENLPMNVGALGYGYQSSDLGRLKNIFLLGKSMYIGTLSGIYKKDDITDVEDNQPINYKNYLLYQNYPNPFNPTTLIRFTIKNSGKVTLKVYDVLGREVAELLNGFHESGSYEVQFNGSNLPSGIYFYNLTSNGNSLTKKMLLLK